MTDDRSDFEKGRLEGFGMAMMMVAHRQGHSAISWTETQLEAVSTRGYSVNLITKRNGEKVWKMFLEPQPEPHPELNL